MPNKITTVRAPAKLILSGEHAVVYGRPALAMAVDCYARTTVDWTQVVRTASKTASGIFFNLLNLKYTKRLTWAALSALKKRILIDYKRFLLGECRIREVLEKPFELLLFTVMQFLEGSDLNKNGLNLTLKTQSDIPMGCGMGSSAASIMSAICAFNHILNLNLSRDMLLNLGLISENLQHGRSSGLDLHVALDGGCVRFQSGQSDRLSKTGTQVLQNLPFFLVNTGTPNSSTGECVEFVRAQKYSNLVWDLFESNTNKLEQSVCDQDLHQIQMGLDRNQQLLTQIGVVPMRVQNFIRDLNRDQLAAKICGAGAVSGDSAGVVLVLGDSQKLKHWVSEYGYILQPIACDLVGAAEC